jgi:periplasmic protein TonB
MTSTGLAPTGPLWAQLSDEDSEALPLWKAALIALALELLAPALVLGIDWSFLHRLEEPPPTPVMSVRLEQPPVEQQPRPPPPEVKPEETPLPPRKIKKRKPAIPIELPKPLPGEAPSRIALPTPEPEPEPVPPKEEKQPEPMPEPAPLPSVFRDVKPVKKVRPIYPPEAEAQHVQGKVKVRLTVALDGSVTDAQVLSADPPGVFEESVLTAVRQYKFKKDGTSYQADQEVVFKIDD